MKAKLHYQQSGDPSAPVVVFSHALGANLSMWEPQMKRFGARYRVLRYDARGHGKSEVPDPPYSLEEMADDLAGLLEDLGVKEAAFVGLSMGGMICQTFALRHPESVRALVLCDTTSEIPEATQPMWDERIRRTQEEGMEPHVESTVERWLTAPTREESPEKAEAIRSWLRGTDPQGYIGCCEAVRGISLTDRLAEIRAPALVLTGDQDAGSPPEVAQRTHEHLASSELVILEGAAHLSSFERPEAFSDAVLDFLERYFSTAIS